MIMKHGNKVLAKEILTQVGKKALFNIREIY